jgi:hypothetical protein
MSLNFLLIPPLLLKSIELIWRTEKKQIQVNFLNIPLERNWMKMVLLEDYSLERESPLVGGFLVKRLYETTY